MRATIVPILITPSNGLSGFRFIDCVATCRTARDDEHPNGYAASRDDLHPRYSSVEGLIGGSVEVTVYPEQFGIPCEKGACFHFLVTPRAVMEACVAAVAEELCPPEYVI